MTCHDAPRHVASRIGRAYDFQMPPIGPEDDARKLFASAIAGTTPLAETARERARPRTPSRPRPEPLVSPLTSRPLDEAASQEATARAAADPHLLKKLRRGQIPVEGKVDLHGLRTVEAFRTLVRAIEGAQQTGRRCLLVVHGKGNHSAEGGVLRAAVAGWLTSPPLDARVLAHATARPEHGGDGARYVLLRKH